jgi:hypothetical protein
MIVAHNSRLHLLKLWQYFVKDESAVATLISVGLSELGYCLHNYINSSNVVRSWFKQPQASGLPDLYLHQGEARYS